MTMLRPGTAALLVAACVAVPAAASPPLPYNVTPLSGPPGLTCSVAEINNLGQRAGQFSVPQGRGHAFLQSGDTLLDLGTIGGWTSTARDVNNLGEVAGNADAGISGSSRAFLYSNGRMRSLGTLGGDFSYATAMNDAGQVVGYSHTLDDREHGFLYANGKMIDIGTLASRNIYSIASDINASGQVTGHWVDDQGYQRGFIYENGVMKDIGTLGGRWSIANAINDAGDIVGIAETMFYGIHGFVRRNGQMIGIGSLGGGGSGAEDIQQSGRSDWLDLRRTVGSRRVARWTDVRRQSVPDARFRLHHRQLIAHQRPGADSRHRLHCGRVRSGASGAGPGTGICRDARAWRRHHRAGSQTPPVQNCRPASLAAATFGLTVAWSRSL